MTKEEARGKTLELVNLFKGNIERYKDFSYDEANARVDFIDKFFELLGWDVRNVNGYSEDYRDVVREDKIRIAGKPKAPDYSFRIGGRRKFFVEAKRPCVNIKEEREPSYQVRRYGYTAKLSFSLLTNFEEFAVYDTRVKPNQNDKASTARVFYCTYETYEKHFDFIYDTFSKEAVLKGAFDRYVVESRKKKGTSEIDREFLKLIDGFRLELASNIALRNEGLSVKELNVAVQTIIDRLVFLRIAEDRRTESYGKLQAITNGENVYARLVERFHIADEKYNSSLFKRKPFIDTLTIDNAVLANIVRALYYPDCPYEFSVLAVEILGHIYEQFLGKTIRLTEGHRAKVEEKPEVRKSGGVYYTPHYIVRYIVEHTVGARIKGLPPEKIADVTVLDSSCGSGSFLLGAYDYLLKYHLAWYTKASRLKKALREARIYEAGYNTYRLTITEKQRILLNNIYGVDIDVQAVEVTKLSLLLRLMEDEEEETPGEFLTQSDFRYLPDLTNNIMDGNSLIGSDYYDDKNMSFFDDDAIERVNAFDWERAFPAVMQRGGFDCVIGNPPYFNIQTLGEHSAEAEYIMRTYKDVWQDKSDILFYFFARDIALSKRYIGLIVSNAFLFAHKGQLLRNYIVKHAPVEHIVNFERFRVFPDASITTAVVILNKAKEDARARVRVVKEAVLPLDDVYERMVAPREYFSVSLKPNTVFALVPRRIAKLTRKIDGAHPKLKELFLVGKGMETAANDIFSFETYPAQFPKEYIRKRLKGENIKRYYIQESDEYLLYVDDAETFDALPAPIKEHLKQHRRVLKKRATVHNEGRVWWRYSRPLHKEFYEYTKIWCSYRGRENAFVLDETGEYIGLTNTTVIFGTNEELSLKYVLALLNSKVLTFRHRAFAKQTGGGIYEYVPNAVEKHPIPALPLEEQHPFITLVDQMHEAQAACYAARTEREERTCQQRVDAIDRQIDALVYALYGLTDEERATVEEELAQ